VESSEELRQVVTRFFEALRDGDEEAVRNRVSRQPGFVYGLLVQTWEFEFEPAREVGLKRVEGLQMVYPLAVAG
jgi:hypothetical protein